LAFEIPPCKKPRFSAIDTSQGILVSLRYHADNFIGMWNNLVAHNASVILSTLDVSLLGLRPGFWLMVRVGFSASA